MNARISSSRHALAVLVAAVVVLAPFTAARTQAGEPAVAAPSARAAQAGTPTGAEPFSIVALPDLQNYTYGDRQATIAAQARWAVATRAALNTQMVVQLGDLVSNFDSTAQWDNVSTGLQPLDDAGMPNTVVPGNHDFDNTTGAVGLYDTYFPPSRYAAASWQPSTARYVGYLGQKLFGADPIDRRNMDNVSVFSAGGRDFVVLDLEWEAPSYAVDWADRVLDAYPDRIAILVTHSFLGMTGERPTVPERPGGTAPQALWDQLVSTHCSIGLVLSGHVSSGGSNEASRIDANTCGRPVVQIMSDYQGRPNGGDGWLRYYTIDPAAGTLQTTTYSPTLDRYETDADSQFTVPFVVGSAPVAAFTGNCTGYLCEFDASGSQDVNGTIESYRWDFGDASQGTGVQVAHTYATAGPFTVTLTVTDDSGLTSAVTHQVWPGTTTPFVQDTFARTVSKGLGTADIGGAWSTMGMASRYSVIPGAAALALTAPGVQDEAFIGSAGTDSDVSTTLATDKTPAGGPVYLTVTGRRVAAGNGYYAKLVVSPSGTVGLSLVRTVGGSESTLAGGEIGGLTLTAGTAVSVRLQVSGTNPTALRVRVWLADQPEPAGWRLVASDGTATLQAAGTVGVIAYLSRAATNAPVTVRMSSFAARPTAPPSNVPPTAAFTSRCGQLTCAFDASGSVDDKGITGYQWTFGDGATSTAAAPQHTYSAAGTYVVTLTVQDAEGATGASNGTVTVSAPTAVFASDSFARTVSSGWGTADVGGAWSVAGDRTRLGVGPSGATMRLDRTSQVDCYLGSVSQTDADVSAVLTVDRRPAGGPIYTTIAARRVSSGTSYAARVLIDAVGTVTVRLTRFSSGAETLLAGPVAVGTTQAGRQIAVRVQVTGTAPTQLRARAWFADTVEPTSWQASATDTVGALQTAGSVGFIGYLSGAATNGPVTISLTSFVGRSTSG